MIMIIVEIGWERIREKRTNNFAWMDTKKARNIGSFGIGPEKEGD